MSVTQTTSLSEPTAASVAAEASSTESIMEETSDIDSTSVAPSQGTSHSATSHASTVAHSDARLSRSSQDTIRKPTPAPQIPGSEAKNQAKKSGSMLGKVNNLLTTDLQAIAGAQEVLSVRKSQSKSFCNGLLTVKLLSRSCRSYPSCGWPCVFI